jgi:hypothetical protein
MEESMVKTASGDAIITRTRRLITVQVPTEPQVQRLTGDKYFLLELTPANAQRLAAELQGHTQSL